MNRNELVGLGLFGLGVWLLLTETPAGSLLSVTPIDTSGDGTGDGTIIGDLGLPTLAGPPPPPALIDTTNDQDILARTIYGEARGEGYSGMQAVANVVMNRANDPANRWPKAPASVCLQPYQFSCWNPGDPNYPLISGADPADAIFDSCSNIASLAILGQLPDITGGAQFYFNPALAAPSWAAGMTKTATIGNHVFYREGGAIA